MKPANETGVQIRTSEDEKAYLVKAAHRCGFKTLSEFMRVSVHEKAKRDLKNIPEPEYTGYKTPTERRQLSAEDSLIFANSILNPKEPNEKLKAVFLKDNEEILKELLAQSQKDAG